MVTRTVTRMVTRQVVRSWIVGLLLMAALGLVACMPVMPAGSGTPAPSEEATVAPSAEATAEPTAEATEEATAEPTAEAAGEEGDMGPVIQQLLAQQLQINLDQVEIVSVEAVEWPDACLGVYTADMMCAQVITPGYRVVLAVDGDQYEYHTNQDGSFVQLFSAPEANIGDPLISWQQTLEFCQALEIGREALAFGPCMGVMMPSKFVDATRQNELEDLITTYAPFEADTPAGTLTFHGQGSTEATPAQQRMIAEWARLVDQEAAAGRSSAGAGLALSWHREGGIAGFCDDLAVYLSGQVNATSCKDQAAENLGSRWLTADEAEQLYTWIDKYASFEYNHDDGNVADSMQVTLIFNGAGTTDAGEAEQQEALDFAGTVYAGSDQ